MDAVFKKLRLKNEKEVYILNAPDSFDDNIKSISDDYTIYRELKESSKIDFVVAFVKEKLEIEELAKQIIPKIEGDAKVWMCYPKGTSKKYTCDFNRDNGWESFAEKELFVVGIASIDDDWSTLRYRPKAFIKKMTRKF